MYFAQIDFFRRVLQVVVADQNIASTFAGMWIPCDIDGISPKNYPSIGDTFDYDRNAFIAPKPFDSWILNETTCTWKAPIEVPTDNIPAAYNWNELTQNWDLI